MAKKKQSPEKKAAISSFIEMYGLESIGDIQEALKDLLGGTIQSMLESELDMELGYSKYEPTQSPKTNYRNGHKPKTLQSSIGEIEIAMPQDRNSQLDEAMGRKLGCDLSDFQVFQRGSKGIIHYKCHRKPKQPNSPAQ